MAPRRSSAQARAASLCGSGWRDLLEAAPGVGGRAAGQGTEAADARPGHSRSLLRLDKDYGGCAGVLLTAEP